MVHTAVSPDAGLAELLTQRARGASTRRLALDVGLGAAVAAALLLWRPAAWPALAAAACCFAAFGAWGLADRHANAGAPWRALRGACAVLGTLAALALACATLFGLLGTWIS